MSEISAESKGGSKKGKPKKLSTRVDFTPMVDLGFLLITFFMLTTSMIKPQTMELVMPTKDKVETKDQNVVKASRAVTIILGKNNKVFYWEGQSDDEKQPEVIATDFSANGIRKFLIQKNLSIMKKVRDLRLQKQNEQMADTTFNRKRDEILSKDKSAPIIIIKATDDASYKDLIDILDEMAICNISIYAIVDISPEDLNLIKEKNI